MIVKLLCYNIIIIAMLTGFYLPPQSFVRSCMCVQFQMCKSANQARRKL